MNERKKINLVITLLFTLCLIATMSILFGSFSSVAGERADETIYYKYYTSVDIQPGDTLWNLSDDFLLNYDSKETYIKEILQVNGLTSSDTIISGQSLMFPYYSTEYKI